MLLECWNCKYTNHVVKKGTTYCSNCGEELIEDKVEQEKRKEQKEKDGIERYFKKSGDMI